MLRGEGEGGGLGMPQANRGLQRSVCLFDLLGGDKDSWVPSWAGAAVVLWAVS